MSSAGPQPVVEEASLDVLLVSHEDIDPMVEALYDEQVRLDVTTARSGERARELIGESTPDCVVLSEELPDTDGITLLYDIREDRPSLPVFLYANEGSEELASEAISAGVTDYVPVGLADAQPTVLSNRIENAVEKQHTETVLAEQERRLARLVDNLPGVVYRGEEGPPRTMTLVQGEAESLAGYDADAVENGGVAWDTDIVHPEDHEKVRDTISDSVGEAGHYEVIYRIRTESGAVKWVWDKGCGVYEDGSLSALEGFVTEITDRVEREQELREYETLLETIPDGAYILDDAFCFRTVNEALTELTGYDREELLGAYPSVIDESLSDSDQLRTDLAVGERDVATVETEVETDAGETFPAEVRFTSLTDQDNGVRGTAGVLRDTTRRKERKRQLERQRERLAAINQLHRVLQDVTESVIEPSTREEMEQKVCERLVESSSYTLAWVGTADRSTRALTPSAVAGTETGYVDEITVTTDETETGQGPAGTAVRTGEMQVVNNVASASEFEPWRDAALARGFQSAAAIPITHRESVYGVLNVYTERSDAFDGSEREILDKLGDILGHAFNAFERKKTLLSDTLTELEFRIPGMGAKLAEGPGDEYEFTIERTVPTGDDEYVQYIAVEGIDPDRFRDLMVSLETADDVGEIESHEDADEHLFEIALSEPPLTTTLDAHGGRICSGELRKGDLHVVVELPPDVDVRSILDAISERYPDTDLIAQRTIESSDRTAEAYRSGVFDKLTEKQRTALEAAYFSGFFEWPRENSGEEIANTLGIAPATFSQHIRTAEQKLIDVLLEHQNPDDRDW
jgi:PAS domain S-box-containing protein